MDDVADPDGRHGVAFEQAVEPGLMLAFPQVAEGPEIREDVLDFVKDQEVLAATRQQVLPELKGAKTFFALDGVAVTILVRHFIGAETAFAGKYPGQFALAGTRRAIEQDVHALGAACLGGFQIVVQQPEVLFNVTEVTRQQAAAAAIGKEVLQQELDIEVGVEQDLLQFGQEFELVGHAKQALVVDPEQAGTRQGSPMCEGCGNGIHWLVEHGGEHGAGAGAIKAAGAGPRARCAWRRHRASGYWRDWRAI